MNTATTDVLVVGGGAAGIYAALEAAREGADVFLLDKSMVGVGGATVMAQMTVAAAIGHAEPDSVELHYQDTLASGRDLTNEPLAALLCEDAPRRIFETRDMRVKWAADGDRLRQVMAPGHSRRRCCYVDNLGTGTGVTKGMKAELRRRGINRNQNLFVTDLITDGSGRVVGAAVLDVARGEMLALWASAVVLACGGLTELYQRSSASVNMTGDAYGLGLGVGAELVDIEMVQFFPIGNLAPRTIGLDPIMWDPFRYKLGGRLTNGLGEEFIERYAGVADEGTYKATRDVVSYAILKEVEAGRGSPNGGAWLDFRSVPPEQVHDAFPPAVEKLLDQGIDLSERAVEVAPMAHYTIGGVRVDTAMRTNVGGLLAAGEAVGGAHGANRLSGNAIPEAFVFGARAGVSAAEDARERGQAAADAVDSTAQAAMRDALAQAEGARGRQLDSKVFLPALRRQVKKVMSEDVGPFRDEEGLARAGERLADIRAAMDEARVGEQRQYNLEWVELFELRMMLRTAEAIRFAAVQRRESRGAHQREDYPGMDPSLIRNGVVVDDGAGLRHRWEPVARLADAPTAAVDSAPTPAG